MHIIKSGKGVPIVATPSVAATPPLAARVSVDATPPVSATPHAIATPSYANTPNMITNDGYFYNYNEGDGVPNDGNDGHTYSSPANEDNSTPMEIDEVVGIVGEPSDGVLQSKLQ